MNLPLAGFLADGGRNAMGAENNNAAFGGFLQTINKNNALLLEILNHGAIMNDFLADIDGMGKFLERDIDDIDRAHYTGTEPSGTNKDDFHGFDYTKDDPGRMVELTCYARNVG